MNNLEYEITRLEEFYNLYQSSNMEPWLKDLVLPFYEEKLSHLINQFFIQKTAYPSKLEAL